MSRIKATLWLSAGLLLMQLAWVIVVPAFGGMDEFDHAFRAASVAQGHWDPKVIPTHGKSRGDLIPVPEDIARSAHHACSVLRYTGPQNCSPSTKPDRAGSVLIASSAALYNPVFYGVVGTIATPFKGATALYAMRLATVLLSDAFLGLAFFLAAGRGRRSPWLTTGVLLCGTPALLDSTATAAPNGLQMCAGIAMWAFGLALRDATVGSRTVPWLLAGVSVAGAAEATVHTTGPLWLFLWFCTMLIIFPWRQLLALWHRHTRAILVSASATALLVIGDVLWTLSHGTNSPSQEKGHFGAMPVTDLLVQPVLWVLQTIGGVPFRNLPVPLPVFAIGLASGGLLMVVAFLSGTRRTRFAQLVIAGITILLPLPLTVVAYPHVGFAWQGRYALPYAFGLILLSASVISRHRRTHRIGLACAYLSALAVGLMQGISVIHVRGIERAGWHGYSTWPLPAPWLLLTFCLAGTLSLLWGTYTLRAVFSPLPAQNEGSTREMAPLA